MVAAGAALAQNAAVADGGVLNAASYARGSAVSAGSLVAIFGTNLASGLAQAGSIPLSTSLGDVQSVKFNGTNAPLLFVSGGQINAQIPWETPAGSVSVVVRRNGVDSAPVTFQTAEFSPGIFSLSGTGEGQGVVVNNADGSIAAPSGSVPGLAAHPARAGDALIIYANGLGPVSPAPTTGNSSTDQLRSTINPVTVLIGGVQAQVLFSGLAPQFVGVNQVNVVVPQGVTAGNAVPLQIRMGSVTSTDKLTIAIQ